MLEILCLISGIVLVVVGLSAPSVTALIVGIILLAIGGVWLIIINTDGDWL